MGFAMPLASSYSYPLLGAFWTILEIFLWVLWIWVLIYVFIDIFRSHDLSGWAKALWFLFVLFIPLIGVLVYLIANHDGMTERRYKDAADQKAQFDQYVRTTASSGGPAAEIDRAKKLLDDGTITQAEFDAIKAKALTAA